MCAHLFELLDFKCLQWFYLHLLQQECEEGGEDEEEEEKHGRPDQTRLGQGQSRLCISSKQSTCRAN